MTAAAHWRRRPQPHPGAWKPAAARPAKPAAPRSVETRMAPSVETPSVETGGRPARLHGRQAGAPSVATGGGSVASAAPAAAVGGGRLRGGLDDLAKLISPVHFQNPAPIVPEPQPLTAGVAPNDRLDAFHRMGCRGGIEARGLAGGIPADPVVKLCRCFDDHGEIIPGRGNRRNPRPWKREIPTVQHKMQADTTRRPQDMGFSRVHLTRPMTLLDFMRGRATPTVETYTPNEETRR